MVDSVRKLKVLLADDIKCYVEPKTYVLIMRLGEEASLQQAFEGRNEYIN